MRGTFTLKPAINGHQSRYDAVQTAMAPSQRLLPSAAGILDIRKRVSARWAHAGQASFLVGVCAERATRNSFWSHHLARAGRGRVRMLLTLFPWKSTGAHWPD